MCLFKALSFSLAGFLSLSTFIQSHINKKYPWLHLLYGQHDSSLPTRIALMPTLSYYVHSDAYSMGLTPSFPSCSHYSLLIACCISGVSHVDSNYIYKPIIKITNLVGNLLVLV